MRDQRGRRGIADAHFAEADDIAALRRQFAHDGCATGNRLGALRLAHRWLFQVIGRAMGDFCVD
jgi:hypothetical protein